MTVHQAANRFAIMPLFVLVLVAVAAVSAADPITVRFTVFPDPADPINVAPLNGSFSFDSSLIVPGGFVEDRIGQLASDITPFTWGDTLWTTANASLWFLRFNANGDLRDFVLGGAGGPAGGSDGLRFGTDDFIFRVPLSGYTLGGVPGEIIFNARTTSPDVVPEPGTLLLLTSGIAALVARRRAIVRRSTSRER